MENHGLVVVPKNSGAGAERPQEPRKPGDWGQIGAGASDHLSLGNLAAR